jgi:NitT/TauT family transport system substrate-binding protein
MRLRIAENFEALFYAPLYALQALGFAESEGLNIEWLPPGGPGGAIDAVRAGVVDVTWGGPMRVLRDRDTMPDDGASLVCFGEVVGRDPFALLAGSTLLADNTGTFDLRRLAAYRLSIVSEVPTPWFCLQQDLRDLGVNLKQMVENQQVRAGLSMPQQIDALQSGSVDIIQLFEPHISSLEQQGRAGVLAQASARGPCCYTAFIASRDGLTRHRPALAALERALARAQQWMATSSVETIARMIAPRFPTVPFEVLCSAVSRYRSASVWSDTPAVSRSGIDRLRNSLLAGGFVSRAASFDDIVASV